MVYRKRVLALTALEHRIVPSAYVVINLADAGPGSLRQAVINANGNIGEDTIQFDSALFASYPGPIVLTSGHITVSDSLIVSGPGNQKALISGNNASRVFSSSASLSILDLSLEGGANPGAPSPGNGGIIFSSATLNLSRCIMGSSASNGGAIYQSGSLLSAYDCVFSGGGAIQGGAIYATGTVNLQYCDFDSVVSNVSGSAGGAIYLASGSLALDSCSFGGCGSPSSTFGKGGAVYANGTFFAKNTTFTNNRANQGGAIYLTLGGTIWNSTISSNTASSTGGGIYGSVNLESTIVSANTIGSGQDIFGAVTAKNCALGTSSGFSIFTDQGGNLAFGLDLQMEIGSFGHGGLVAVCAILATSPCKNMGSNPDGLTTDPRGPTYDRVVGSAPDIGAFEIQPPPQVSIQINDGAVQRSRVTRVSVEVNTRDISLTSGPNWEMTRPSDNATLTLALDGPTLSTPTSRTFYLKFTGGPVDGDSLADGVYQLRVFASKMKDGAGQFLDGNGDGIGGDDYISPTTPGDPNRIFRLFGDANGDGAVSGSDFNLFRTAFGGSSAMFDFDNDGSVSANDFTQFKMRFGASI